MPSLFRFLAFIAIVAGIIFGGMVALDLMVEPHPREMTERIPSNRLP